MSSYTFTAFTFFFFSVLLLLFVFLCVFFFVFFFFFFLLFLFGRAGCLGGPRRVPFVRKGSSHEPLFYVNSFTKPPLQVVKRCFRIFGL